LSSGKNDSADHSRLNANQTWELVAEGDWLVGQRFTINNHAVLGRESSCDIIIPGTHLSRRHAELAVKGSKLLIRDLGSSNGTYVNNQKITETELKPGDTIRFDVLLFRIHGPTSKNIDHNATIIRPVPKNIPKPAPTPKRSASKKSWQQKPGATGNRTNTSQSRSKETTTNPLWIISYALIGAATLAGLAYLLTQL